MKRYVLILLCLAGCGASPPTSPPFAIPPPTERPTPAATPTPRPAPSTPAPSATPPPPPTPPPPILLAERDPLAPISALGPVGPGGRWLTTRIVSGTGEPRFGIIGAGGSANPPGQRRQQPGVPLAWTPEGSLVIFASAERPADLLALEPISGQAGAVITGTQGQVRGAAWLATSAVLYAVEDADSVAIYAYRGPQNRSLFARYPGRQLLEGGLIGSGDGRTAALILSNPLTPSLDLYRLDAQTGQSVLLDTSAISASIRPGAVWSPYGQLAYEIGGGLRLFDPQLNIVSPAGFGARPLDWHNTGFLIRRHDTGTLTRWNTSSEQFFDSGQGQLIVDDARALIANQVVLLIDGQIWQVTIP